MSSDGRTPGIELVEYGSYACPYCRAANEHIAEARDALGERLAYVFRHRPLTGSDIARRAAVLAERAPDADGFWRAHVTLMTRSPSLSEDDLAVVAADLGLGDDDAAEAARAGAGRRGRAERQGERRAGDADLLHERPALRRGLGRELVPGRDARHARAPGPGGGARLRRLGAVGRPPAAAGDGAGDRADQLAARAGVHRVLAARGGDRRSAAPSSGCRCCTGSTTRC